MPLIRGAAQSRYARPEWPTYAHRFTWYGSVFFG